MKDLFVDINTENPDLEIIKGDFSVKDGTAQHQAFLLLARKGEIRPFPRVGVGIDDYLNNDKGGLEFAIRKEFERDGMTIKSLSVSSTGQVEVNASYE